MGDIYIAPAPFPVPLPQIARSTLYVSPSHMLVSSLVVVSVPTLPHSEFSQRDLEIYPCTNWFRGGNCACTLPMFACQTLGQPLVGAVETAVDALAIHNFGV